MFATVASSRLRCRQPVEQRESHDEYDFEGGVPCFWSKEDGIKGCHFSIDGNANLEVLRSRNSERSENAKSAAEPWLAEPSIVRGGHFPFGGRG